MRRIDMRRGMGILMAALVMALMSPAAGGGYGPDAATYAASAEEVAPGPGGEREAAAQANADHTEAEQPRVLMPGGESVGVALLTRGVVVAGLSDVGSAGSPARAAGLQPGDRLISVNGAEIENAAHLAQLLQQKGPVQLRYERDGRETQCAVDAAWDAAAGAYRLGAWVRDSTAGLGTLTYYDPADGRYGALGHAITDMDTSIVMPIGEGAIYRSDVVDIHRGRSGVPGELMGSFSGEEALGSLDRNTDFGIFGQLYEPVVNPLYPEGVPLAGRDEVHEGEAQLLTTLDDGELKQYDCRIVRLYRQEAPATRSMVVRVTDPALLQATGGIVQGMSGSPILQDGRLVGAVTHVFVNDPTQGYGVYLDWMLEADAA